MALSVPLPASARLALRFRSVSGSVFRFREEAAWLRATVLVLGFAGLTGLAAQISFTLPFTPVPVTGQVFAVLLASSVLGRRLGPASQFAYVGLGAVGVPWFASSGAAPFSVGGWAVLAGASGGYLWGFVLASLVVGVALDRAPARRTFSGNLLILLLGVAIIYAVGAAQLAHVYGLSAHSAILLGVVPFLPGDLLKSVLVATLLVAALPIDPAATLPSDATRVQPLRRRDYALVGVLLAGVWALAGIVALDASAPRDLVAWYALAAAIASVTALVALLLRRTVERALAAAPRPAAPA